MMVESGATYNVVDPFPTPRLKKFIRDYRVFTVPQIIVRIVEHVDKGIATGNVQGTVTDDCGHKKQFYFGAVVVQGKGFNLFFVTTAM